MSARRWITAFLLAGLLACIAGGGIWIWRKSALENRALTTLQQARDLLKAGKAGEAWALTRATRPPEPGSHLAGSWFDLEVELAVATRQLDRLRRLEKENPARTKSNPAAVQWLQRTELIRGGRLDPALPVSPDNLILKADEALQAGNVDEARRLLESGSLEGTPEINRLTRLALLNSDNVDEAWRLISKAYAIDPHNADVRTFSANLLEKRGAVDAARRDYVAALLMAPDNPRMRDNLAEFYLRQGQLRQAVEVWSGAAANRANVPLRLKAWFWNRVGFGAELELKASTGLIERLASLPPHAFWSASLDSALQTDPPLAKRDEIIWLRTLEAIRDGKEQAAWSLISKAGTDEGSRITLRSAAQYLLGVRTGEPAGQRLNITPELEKSHPFWGWLAAHDQDAEALRQPWVLPALFAVNGWLRASLDLLPQGSAGAAPDWAEYTFAESARLCGDKERMREILASSRSDSPALTILKAQSAWMQNRAEEGRDLLEPLLGTPDAGYRAAWLLGLFYLERGELDDVKRVVARQPDFAGSIAGQELLARVHLLRKEEDLALAIYLKLGEASDEGRLYRAHLAYTKKNWDEAEAITRSLMASHPNEPQFAKNLDSIRKARLEK